MFLEGYRQRVVRLHGREGEMRMPFPARRKKEGNRRFVCCFARLPVISLTSLECTIQISFQTAPFAKPCMTTVGRVCIRWSPTRNNRRRCPCFWRGFSSRLTKWRLSRRSSSPTKADASSLLCSGSRPSGPLAAGWWGPARRAPGKLRRSWSSLYACFCFFLT